MNRIEKLRSEMKKSGLAALLLTQPMSIAYLTGVKVAPGERFFAAFRVHLLHLGGGTRPGQRHDQKAQGGRSEGERNVPHNLQHGPSAGFPGVQVRHPQVRPPALPLYPDIAEHQQYGYRQQPQ